MPAMDNNEDDTSGSEQSDYELEQDILSRLHDYGDRLLGDDNEVRAAKQPKRNKVSAQPENSLQTVNDVKKRKKKKRKSQNLSDKPDGDMVDEVVPAKVNHFDQLKSMLSLTEEEISKLKAKKASVVEKRDTTLDPVVTDANLLKRKKRLTPEVIVFEDPAKRQKQSKKPVEEIKTQNASQAQTEAEEFDLRRARWEVRTMAVKSLNNKEKEDAQVALAVKLGAVPPKNPRLNYKELMQKRKMEKLKEAEKREMMQKLGYTVSKQTDSKKKRNINDVGMVDGQIGKFKFGVQKISTRDVNKLSKPNSNKFQRRRK